MGLIALVSNQLPIRWSEGTCWDLQLPWFSFVSFFFLVCWFHYVNSNTLLIMKRWNEYAGTVLSESKLWRIYLNLKGVLVHIYKFWIRKRQKWNRWRELEANSFNWKSIFHREHFCHVNVFGILQLECVYGSSLKSFVVLPKKIREDIQGSMLDLWFL